MRHFGQQVWIAATHDTKGIRAIPDAGLKPSDVGQARSLPIAAALGDGISAAWVLVGWRKVRNDWETGFGYVRRTNRFSIIAAEADVLDRGPFTAVIPRPNTLYR